MLPRNRRATRADLIRRHEEAVRGKLVSISYTPHPGRVSRVACSVAKKVAQSAVERNTLKRRCRAIVAQQLSNLPTPIVATLRLQHPSRKASYDELAEEIGILFKRIASRL